MLGHCSCWYHWEKDWAHEVGFQGCNSDLQIQGLRCQDIPLRHCVKPKRSWLDWGKNKDRPAHDSTWPCSPLSFLPLGKCDAWWQLLAPGICRWRFHRKASPHLCHLEPRSRPLHNTSLRSGNCAPSLFEIFQNDCSQLTSVASARVGRGTRSIESNIWVAVTTNLPRDKINTISRSVK